MSTFIVEMCLLYNFYICVLEYFLTMQAHLLRIIWPSLAKKIFFFALRTKESLLPDIEGLHKQQISFPQFYILWVHEYQLLPLLVQGFRVQQILQRYRFRSQLEMSPLVVYCTAKHVQLLQVNKIYFLHCWSRIFKPNKSRTEGTAKTNPCSVVDLNTSQKLGTGC